LCLLLLPGLRPAAAFSIVEFKPRRIIWQEVQTQVEDQHAGVTATRLRHWLSAIRDSAPELVFADELDHIRLAWRIDQGHQVKPKTLRTFLRAAYRSAPSLRDSFARIRLEMVIDLSLGEVERARQRLAPLTEWCKSSEKAEASAPQDFNGELCSTVVLPWLDRDFAARNSDAPEHIEGFVPLAQCQQEVGVVDPLEADLVLVPELEQRLAAQSLVTLWPALLAACELADDSVLLPLRLRRVRIEDAVDQALHTIAQTRVVPKYFVVDDLNLPWPERQCTDATSSDCTPHQAFDPIYAEMALVRLAGLLSAEPASTSTKEKADSAQRSYQQALAAVEQRDFAAARRAFAEASGSHWQQHREYGWRLVESLVAGAAPPPQVYPPPAAPDWTYSFHWFDEQDFLSYEQIYQNLLTPEQWRHVQVFRAWQSVLQQASDAINDERAISARCTPEMQAPEMQASMPLVGVWHGTHLQVEGLSLPWPKQFEWFLASDAKALPEAERLALFACMKVEVMSAKAQ
jgi:hypothetical protein